MASYQEEIAQLRQQRAQYERAETTKQIQEDYAQAKYMRDEALQRGDPADWHEFDRECEALEQTWARYYAPQPQADPRAVAYLNRKKVFVDRHGQAAIDALGRAHQYATAPRNPSTNNPNNTGMGLRGGSPAYFKAMDDLLEMYAGDLGLKYDAKEDTLSPNEAARNSGLSANEYNNGVRKMYSEGKNSASEAAANWSRKVG